MQNKRTLRNSEVGYSIFDTAESFDPEWFDPELATEGLTTEGLVAGCGSLFLPNQLCWETLSTLHGGPKPGPMNPDLCSTKATYSRLSYKNVQGKFPPNFFDG